MSFAHFSLSCGFSSHSFDSIFPRAENLNASEVQLINYFFYGSFCIGSKKSLPDQVI